ncbi:MAG: ComEC family competence protein [Alphaproteobacteria bacterium]|nr:ComEC family competence protein [Alphaproteobacteria bacterium]
MPGSWGTIASILDAERHRCILWLPVLVGIGIGIYFALPVEPPASLASILAIFAIGGLIAAYCWPALRPLILLPVAISIGLAAAQWRSQHVAAPVLDGRYGPAPVFGRVVQVDRLPTGPRVILDQVTLSRIGPGQTPDRIRIRLHRGSPVQIGDRISVFAKLRPPPPPVAPGAYDFQRAAWFKRIGAVGFALGPVRPQETLQSPRGAEGLTMGISRLRQRIAGRLRAALPGQAGQIAAALLVGDRSGLDRAVVEAMRDSGLAHLLAISGLHVGLVAATLFFAIRLLLTLIEPIALRWPVKKIAAFMAFLGAFAYLLLAGATIPTQRAFLMTGIVLLAVMLDRTAISLRLVAAAAAIILILAPESLTGASFQLSFAAVVALVAVYEGVGHRLRSRSGPRSVARRLALYMAGVGLTTLIAGAATGLIALHHFGRFAQFGVVANLIAVPVTALWIMPWGVVALILYPFGLDFIALQAMAQGIEVVLAVSRTVAAWPGAVTLLPTMPIAGLLLVAFGGLWLCLWSGRMRFFGVLGLVAGVLTIPLTPRPDILVSEDGRLMAVRMADGRLSLSSNRVQKFAARVWLERDGARDGSIWPTEASTDRWMACDLAGCIYRPGRRVAALVRDGRALAEDCLNTAIVISIVPVRRRCSAPALVIDRFDLWRGGAHAVWLGQDTVSATSVGTVRGVRPWVWQPAKLRLQAAQRR